MQFILLAFDDKEIMIQDNKGFICAHWTKHLDQNPPVLCFKQYWLTTLGFKLIMWKLG